MADHGHSYTTAANTVVGLILPWAPLLADTVAGLTPFPAQHLFPSLNVQMILQPFCFVGKQHQVGGMTVTADCLKPGKAATAAVFLQVPQNAAFLNRVGSAVDKSLPF